MNDRFKELFIFEMANNHQGSVQHGLDIIHALGEVTRKYKINAAVKFQYRDLDTMIHPEYINRSDVKHIPRFLSTRLSGDEFYTLVQAVRDEGMHTMCTPFDETSVDLCMDHGIETLKVASCSSTDWPLMEAIAATKRPVIVSTGGKTFSDMDKIYNFMLHRDVDFAMLHCVGLYPVGYRYVQLNCIDKIKNRYPGIPYGYSGHENPNDYSIAQMAVAKGASILERHIGLATDTITLNSYSTDVRDISGWIEAVQNARTICGTDKKFISNEELQSMNELARGCYAAREIKERELIQREDVFFAMPCSAGQMSSGQFQEGIRATRNYAKNEAIVEQQVLSLMQDTRSIIHDVKGMLYEAKIVLSPTFQIELSHHYGLEHFRHYGATIINIINREYCKKLIIMLPGQQHPDHYHKVKEESFQVLFGTLTLTLDGVKRELHAGEVVTVMRGMHHAFTSEEGCIFEEVSTTHVRNDSYYGDSRISKLDIMQRKTIIDDYSINNKFEEERPMTADIDYEIRNTVDSHRGGTSIT